MPEARAKRRAQIAELEADQRLDRDKLSNSERKWDSFKIRARMFFRAQRIWELR